MSIHNYDTGNKPEGRTWDTKQLQEDFEVTAFGAPFVAVKRRYDGKVGSLEFRDQPRVYWNFQEA